MTSDDGYTTADKTGLTFLLERFPEKAGELERLFWKSPAFRSLCKDYRDCLAAWQYWCQPASAEAPPLCQSYAALLQELEEEVRQYLKPEKDAPVSPEEAGGGGKFENQR